MTTYEIVYLNSNGFRDFERVKADSVQQALNWFTGKFGGAAVYSVEAVDANLPEWAERHGGGHTQRLTP